MYPVVIIQSFGQDKSENIIKKILKQSGQAENPFKIQGFLAYECELNTKYYNTKIILISSEKDLSLLPSEILKYVEAAFFYFDSYDKDFIKKVSTLCTFVQKHNIQLPMLITRNLAEEESKGLTYTAIKDVCKHEFEIIDLEDLSDTITDKQDDYYEIWDMLNNHVWSTVEIPSRNCLDTSNASINDTVDNMEEKLNLFEELLTKAQNIKESSKTLSREQLLNNAEQLAELLINVIVED